MDVHRTVIETLQLGKWNLDPLPLVVIGIIIIMDKRFAQKITTLWWTGRNFIQGRNFRRKEIRSLLLLFICLMKFHEIIDHETGSYEQLLVLGRVSTRVSSNIHRFHFQFGRILIFYRRGRDGREDGAPRRKSRRGFRIVAGDLPVRVPLA